MTQIIPKLFSFYIRIIGRSSLSMLTMNKVFLNQYRFDLGLFYEKENGGKNKAIKKAALFERLF